MKYLLEIIDDLFFAKIDDRLYLIDTVSPYSFVKNDKIIINGKEFVNSKLKSVLNDRIQKISERTNKNVYGIIGLDIIKENGLTIDKKNKEISFEVTNVNGKRFSYDYVRKDIYEYIELSFMTNGLTPYGIKKYILDSGVSDSIFDLDVCVHSQYAYRKDIYYLALDILYSNDFVFENLSQKEESLYIEASMNYDRVLSSQLEFVGASGLLSLNKYFDNYLVIDTKNNILLLD